MNNRSTRDFSEQLYRLKILKPKFWDNVKIQKKELRNYIIEWLSTLKYYRNITIDKFSDLFSGFDGIVFPIRIGGFKNHLQITDNSGKEFYMCYMDYNYHKINKYGIGMRADGFDTEFIFKLTDTNEVVLQELFLLKLNKDNNNTDKSVNFYYNSVSKITTVVLETNTLHLEITYPWQNSTIDKQISQYLFGLTDKFIYIDNVFFVLEYMSDMLKNLKKKHSLKITSRENKKFDEDKRILSEIWLLDGIVTRYSVTERSDCMICLNEFLLSEELEKFILSHKK